MVTNHGTAPAASDAVTKPTVPAGNKWTIDSVKWADASGNALTGADLTNFFKDNTDGASVTIDGTNYSNAKAGYILVSYRRGTNADGTQLIKLPVRIKSDADNIDPSGVTFDTAHGNTVKTHANAASADPASGQITVKDSNGNTVTSWTFAGWSTKAGNSYSDISATALTNDLKDSNLNSDGVHDIDNVYAKIKLADNSVIHTPAMKIHVLGGVGQAKTYTARKPTDPAPAASDGVKNYTAMHDAFGGAAYKWVEYTGSGTPTHGAAGLSNWTNFTDRTTDAQGNLVANNNIYVEIKYSDGTYQYVKAPLTIQRASDLYGSHVTVNSNGITTHVNAPAADYAPSNGQGFTETGIPSNVTVTYAWNSTPDVTDSNLNSQGKKDETKSVKLTFTDTSTGLSSAISKEVVVHVIGGVAASEHQSVQQGDLPSVEQAQAAIGNNAALAPYHAGYSWYLQKNGAALTTADTALPAGTNSGTKQVWVKISYQKADGTADGEQWVQTTLNLTNSLSRQFHDQLSSNAVTVVKGTVLSGTLTNGSVENAVVQDPRSGYYHQGTFRVVNTPTGFPSDAVFSWASPVDTSSVGNVSTRIKVTYSDRSTDYIPAVVNVIDHLPTMAESTTPTGGEIWVAPNTQLTPTSDPGHYAEQGITNHGNMPAGTKYTWQASVDTSQPGSRLAGIVKVSYSDGSFNTAGVVVHVNGTPSNPDQPTVPSDASRYTPQGQDLNKRVGESLGAAEQAIRNTNGARNAATNEWLPSNISCSWESNVTGLTASAGNKAAIVRVTYHDRTYTDVPIIVHVTANPSEAERYEPTGQDITVVKNMPVGAAKNGIANVSALPSNASYSWADHTPDTSRVGDVPASVKVTYQDGSMDTVGIFVHVIERTPAAGHTRDSDRLNPIGGTITANKSNQTLTPEDVLTALASHSFFPSNEQAEARTVDPHYSWVNQDFGQTVLQTTGLKNSQILITYSDHSTDTVMVVVNVKDLAANYSNLTAQTITAQASQNITAKQGLANVGSYPNFDRDVRQVEFISPADLTPNTATANEQVPTYQVLAAGTYNENIKVTFNDGSTKTLATSLVVSSPSQSLAEVMDATGGLITRAVGYELKSADAQEAVSNSSTMPRGTTYAWATTPDTSTKGLKSGAVKLHFSDNSEKTVTVHVDVKSMTDEYTPLGQDIRIAAPASEPLSGTDHVMEGIRNASQMPSGTQYAWAAPVDISQADATVPGLIKVSYRDGSAEMVAVNVIVGQPENNPQTDNPVAQIINVNYGEVFANNNANAKRGVQNTAQMPSDATYSFVGDLPTDSSQKID